MFPSFLFTRAPARLAAASLLMLGAGCDIDTSASVATPRPVDVADAAAYARQAIGLRPSGFRYSDAGVKPSTGRAGSAQVWARALLNRNGSVLVEVATDPQFAQSAPGQITQVVVKRSTPSGTVTSTFDGGDRGYWAQAFDGVRHQDPIDLQVNVRGFDGRRIAVVSVGTRVVRRPDIEVAALVAPARAPRGEQVGISATVRELNREVGTSAMCALTVDGVRADDAEAVWVDAGTEVTCAFQMAFTALGQRRIEVAVYDANPGDWNPANNSVSGTIDVVDPAPEWQLSFAGHDRTFDYVKVDPWGGDKRYVGDDWKRESQLHAWFEDSTDATSSVVFTAQFMSDDEIVGVAHQTAERIERNGEVCHYGYNAVTSTLFQTCRKTGTKKRSMRVFQTSTRAIYFGYRYFNDDLMVIPTDQTSGFGAFAVGSGFRMDVTAIDPAGTRWQVGAGTPVAATAHDFLCAPDDWDGTSCHGTDKGTLYQGQNRTPGYP